MSGTRKRAPSKGTPEGSTGGGNGGDGEGRNLRFLPEIFSAFHQSKTSGKTTVLSIVPTNDGRLLFSLSQWTDPKNPNKINILLSLQEIAELSAIIEIYLRKTLWDFWDYEDGDDE